MKGIKNVVAVTALLITAAEAQNIPPVQYVDGVPACPRDQDIKNIDTRLSARVVRPKNEGALLMEKSKATHCRQVGGRYSQADWKRMNAVINGDN